MRVWRGGAGGVNGMGVAERVDERGERVESRSRSRGSWRLMAGQVGAVGLNRGAQIRRVRDHSKTGVGVCGDGVSVVQGPDGDEITFSGQRGVFNNISLDGGDFNNGFFGEQVGGQRAAIDVTLDAAKEFQVVASGANAECGRTAGGEVKVIAKSGTNQTLGSLSH